MTVAGGKHLTPNSLAAPQGLCSTTLHSHFAWRVTLYVIIAISILLTASTLSHAQGQSCNTGDFFRRITGDWIGVCQQTTDGEKADDKYFHVAIKKMGDSVFESRFEYYRLDPKTGAPVRAGESLVTTTIGSDGLACSKIMGKGTVMVYNAMKTQQHVISETAGADGPNSVRSSGKGTVSVSGMPLGLGKNGKVNSTKSVWTLSDDESLSIRQTLKIGFRALIIGKSFSMTADYKAKKGTDVASLMTGKAAISAQPSRAVFQ
jgi:hypothetical protein